MIDIEYIEHLLSKSTKVELHSHPTPNGTGAIKFVFESLTHYGQSLIHYLGLRFKDEELSLTISLIEEKELHILFHSNEKGIKFKTGTRNFDLNEVNNFFDNVNYIDSWTALGCYYPSSTPISNIIAVKDDNLSTGVIYSLKVKIYKYEL